MERLDDVGSRVVAVLGEARARELLDALTRPEADRAALIGRLAQREDAECIRDEIRRTPTRGAS